MSEPTLPERSVGHAEGAGTAGTPELDCALALQRTEECLKLERRRLDEVQRLAGIGLWEYDLVRNTLHLSPEVFRILDVEPGDVSTAFVRQLEFVHPEDRERVRTAYTRSLELRQPYRITHRLLTPAGRTKWVEERCETDFAPEGTPLVSRGTVQDVTDVKAARDAARRSAEMVASFLRLSPEAVVVANTDGTIASFSEGAEKVFRCRRQDVIGRSVDVLMPERYRTAHRANITEFLASDRISLLMGERSEITAQRLTGEQFTAEASVVKVPSEEGMLLAVIVRDISERKAYEVALKTAKARAEAANEAKSSFLAMMSHEIRTPMNGVLGMLGVLVGTRLDDRQREMVETALEAGKSLMEILGDILDYSRIEAGLLELEVAECDVRRVLKKTESLHILKAVAAGIEIAFAPDPSLPCLLMTDAIRIQQILHNLVGNALKFTAHGRVEVRARYEPSSPDDGTLVLDVEDTGIGMSPLQLERIFDRFTQADASITRRYGGSGLGLAIVKGIVDAMGGTIAVTSEIGAGSCFTVRIPAERAGHSAPHPSVRWRESVKHRPLKVLVVEDNEINRETLRLLLMSEGIAPTLASNGEEAVETFRPDTYDLVLMDIQMPVLDGMSALKVIRKVEDDAKARHTRIIACSAYTDDRSMTQFMRMGFDGVLPKPVDPEAIHALLETVEDKGAASA